MWSGLDHLVFSFVYVISWTLNLQTPLGLLTHFNKQGHHISLVSKTVTAASNMLCEDHKDKFSINHYYSATSTCPDTAHFKTLTILQTLF